MKANDRMNPMASSGNFTFYDALPINVRCPSCGHIGAFGKVQQTGTNSPMRDAVTEALIEDQKNGGTKLKTARTFGMRVCPNDECRSVLFFVSTNGQRTCFPPEIIDFDSSNLPPMILESLEEAIKCHASGCYRAAALMVRRTLEEMCKDKQASGDNLKERISKIGSLSILPAELLSAADELRILGNDAAHVKAKDYDKIGEAEVAIAIELTKELLKAVYQYTNLLKKLTDLKKT